MVTNFKNVKRTPAYYDVTFLKKVSINGIFQKITFDIGLKNICLMQVQLFFLLLFCYSFKGF